eukprot:g7962.t1
MSVFASTWEIERGLERGWSNHEESEEVHNEASAEERSSRPTDVEERSSYAGSSGSDAQQPEKKPSVGFFQGMFRTSGDAKAGAEGDGDISQYWENYDLSVSEAPKLFSDAEFEAVKRIQDGLKVLVLRKRLQVKGLQSVIAEVSSPDSFYFDGTGVLRRVTSSIFDDRGNVAQREALKKERQARFQFRQAEAEARLASLRQKADKKSQNGVMALVHRSASVQSIPRTSEILFFSSLHGREKRLERGIEKRDLQAAVKYGTRRRGHPNPRTGEPRWMYTLGNLVYITDDTSTKEITSYCLPIRMPVAPLSQADLYAYESAKEDLRRNPNLCTSHTVIVVDHSRSMSKKDVTDHVNRIKASFELLAIDFVAKQIADGVATNTDVVSVLLMHDGVDVLFEREPMGRFLYNRLIDIRDKVRPRSHGNYLPSIDQVEQLLRDDSDRPNTSLLFLFLSDGRPSDNATGLVRGGNQAMSQTISDRVGLLAGTFRHRLNVATVGFAAPGQDFSVLESMAEAAQAAGAATGKFLRPELSSSGLASALASAVSSLTHTKSTLASTLVEPAGRPGSGGGGGGCGAGGRLCLPPIQESLKESPDSEHVDGWIVYRDEVERMEYRPESIFGVEEHPWQVRSLLSASADALAIRKVPFDEGAERVVFKMQEVDTDGDVFVGPPMVGKQSKRLNEDLSSINTSAKALTDAGKLARAFNQAVQGRLSACRRNRLVDSRVWGVQFLSCSTYSFADGNGNTRIMLAEKWLDTKAFRKWNSNNGYVFHGRGHASLRQSSAETVAQRTAAKAHADRLMNGADGGDAAIDYGTGAEDYVSGQDGGGGGGGGGGGIEFGLRKRSHAEMTVDFLPRPTDYLQAFSHFTYHHSERTMLVCDLQGVMSDNSPEDPHVAGVFELTDPVIHFQSKTGQKQVYGRTDLGRKGMHKFFRTHECNDVCKLLDLPGSRSPEVEAFAKIAKAARQRGRKRRKS